MSRFIYILLAILFIGLTALGIDAADIDLGSILTGQDGVELHYEQQNQASALEVYVGDLPAEAQDTLKLIKQGGPFPYSKDGIVFYNREGQLPDKPKGYYHEYTVKTPGVTNRGARRIVTGAEGEYYYTDDHYRTFKLVKE
jgi:ribonuclease T1